jgi:hypothetical protein
MNRRIAVFLFVFALALRAGQSANAALVYIDPIYGVQVTKNVQYGLGAIQDGSKTKFVPLYADIYQPVDIGLGQVLPNRPGLVLQDGGAWSSADKNRERITTPAIYTAQRGYTVVVTDYRQSAPAVDIPLLGIDEEGGDVTSVVGQTKFGNQPYNGLTTGFIYGIFPGINAIRSGVEDFAVAMDWTRTNAAALGIDPTRIGLAGGSAGGIDGLLLQYNNNNVPNNGLTTVNPAYAAQAVVALVSTMDGNHGKIQAGGPPVFLLNNKSDAIVPWSQPMLDRFNSVGIYTEAWFQKADLLSHGVDFEYEPPGSGGRDVLELMRDFLATKLAGGPVVAVIPEPSSIALVLTAMVTLGFAVVRRKSRAG